MSTIAPRSSPHCSELRRILYSNSRVTARVADSDPTRRRDPDCVGGPIEGVFMLVALVFLIVLGLSGLRIAQEYQRGVVFRLGRYVGLRGPGLYWIIPLGIERAMTIDIRTRTVSAEQQETINRDSVTIKVNAVLWYRIVDAAKSVIEVVDAPTAVYQLALTGLRNIIGQHDLDEVLQERNKINALLGESISGSTAAWGLEVQRFEMKDVELPKAMQQVMAMQAEE